MSTSKAIRNIAISTPSMGNEEWEALKEPIFSGWITQGPKVKEFESIFAGLHSVEHALAVSNCTTALHLALVALGIGPDDEVIVPAFTWVATANVVEYCSATPVFIDIDTATFNIDIEQLKQKLTGKTKAIIAVHLFGLCADIETIKEIAPGIAIVEDAACASGAGIEGKMAGSMGDIGCFSFHPRKSVTTGEGGMLTTNSDEVAEKLNMLRNHGASISEEQRHHGPQPYILPAFDMVGYNYRMTDLQGAVGVVQLRKLSGFVEERTRWANYYNEQLKDIDWLNLPVYDERYKHGWQSYVVMVDEQKSPMKRNELMQFLHANGVSTRPGTHAVHMLGYYAGKYDIQPQDYPNAFAANEFSMSIPLHNKMTAEDYEYIVDLIKGL
ncbi:MAG: DegT/DnrJ/EryC1/StrS family aminotransferase [Sphingobacteriales bacterium]|nr:MAG: DegT/DnrJ/EryC1/StrS family aminotransferase [Sphingobacteriales bacterium]